MPWTSPVTRTTGYSVTAANWNELVNNNLFLEEVAYTEFTSNVTVTATTAATAQTVVSAGAITYEAAPHMIEFFSSRVATGSGGGIIISLWDSTTELGRIAQLSTSVAGSTASEIDGMRRLTPTAASHTYIIKAWRTTADGTVHGGTGGTDTNLPGFIRITRIPT